MTGLIVDDMDPLLSADDVAGLFGVRETTVDRWRKAGRLDTVLSGGAYRYRRWVVEALLDAPGDPQPEAAG